VTEEDLHGLCRAVSVLDGPVFVCPAVQELYHNERVAAYGQVDSDCSLVADGDLAPRFSAVSLRSLAAGAEEVPCWAWDNGALTEAVLGRVSLYTLVWETRMTGYDSAGFRSARVVHVLSPSDVWWVVG